MSQFEYKTVPAFLLPALLKTGLDFDVDIVAILATHGINLETLNMDSDRIPADRFDAVMEEVVRLTQNPALGLNYAHHFGYDYIPEMESYLLSASTLRESMLAYRWMGALFDSLVTARYETNEQAFTARLEIIPGTPYWVARLFSECSFSLVSRLTFQKAGPDFRLKKVNFAHDDLAALPAYKNEFRCPIFLDQEYYSIVFDIKDVDRILDHDSPALKALSKVQIEQRVARLTGKKSILESLSMLLMAHPYLIARGISEVSSKLYFSPRTLQRKLRLQGTSYREVIEQVRFELAKQYLKDGTAIETISDLLCFSDRRSFTRAFQRWEGTTPSKFQKSFVSA